MIRIIQLVAIVIVTTALCAGAQAQSVANGQQIYQSVCASCHGPASLNFHNIVTTGANNPSAILAAWLRPGSVMNGLQTIYSAADRADIAAYLATFLPASGEIRASATQLDFGTQPVGTRSATQTLTISNFTGSVTISSAASNNAPEFPIVADTCTGATLGANATCRLDIAFNPATTGPRGAAIMIANSGVVNPVSITALGAGGTAAPVNYQGLWWNPAESGWGVNLAHQGDLIYLTWYMYDASGKAWWLAMLATKSAPGTYTGDIFEVHGSPYDVVPYNVGAKSVATVGSGTLTFSSATVGTFSYTAKSIPGTKSIAKYSLGGPVPVCTYSSTPNLAAATNYQDLWWNPAEDGWGINLTHEGSSMYATWYTYDIDGSPLWVLSLMTQTAPGTWSGSLLRGSGPPFGGAFDPSQVHLATVGTAILTISNGNSATWTYTLGSASGTKSMTRTLFGAPAGTPCQ